MKEIHFGSMETVFSFIFTLQGCLTTWAHSDPFYVWPLSPEHPTAEIVTNTSTGSAGCVLHSVGHPMLDYDGLKLQGCENSYADINVDTTDTIAEFSIMIFVSPTGFNGTFLHYQKQSQTGSSTEIINIILSYENLTTFLYITGDSSTDILHMASLVSNFQDGDFIPILIVYDSTSHSDVKVMYLNVGTATTRIKMFVEDKVLGLPGKIRIGGTFYPGHGSYVGRVTCLQFYDIKITSADYDIALNRCMSTLWPFYMGGQPAQRCNTERGFFHRKSSGHMPQLSIVPVASFNISSKVKCANSCMLPNYDCVSFAFNTFHKSCYLFDMDYSSSLVSEIMTDYYVTNTVNCCCL